MQIMRAHIRLCLFIAEHKILTEIPGTCQNNTLKCLIQLYLLHINRIVNIIQPVPTCPEGKHAARDRPTPSPSFTKYKSF